MSIRLFTAMFCFLAALLALPVFIYLVGRTKERVVITENVVEGDPAAAAGVVMEITSAWNGHLMWSTEYAIGSGKEAVSRFAFSELGESGSRHRSDGGFCNVGIPVSYNVSVSEVGEEELMQCVPLPQPVAAAAAAGLAGEEAVTVSLEDYYEYCPLYVQMSAPERGFYYYSDAYDSADGFWSGYLEIPMPKESRMQIRLEKDAEGGDDRYVGIECTAGEAFPEIKTVAVFAQDGCYFICYPADGEDGSLLKPGENYGIHYMAYRPVEEGERTRLTADWESVGRVYELEETCRPVAMELDETRSCMYLLLEKEQIYYLDVLQVLGDASCARLQRVEILDIRGTALEGRDSWVKMIPGQDGILFTFLQDGMFAYAAGSPDKGYELWCVDFFPGVEITDGVRTSVFPYEQSVLFDGKRLVLAAFKDWTSCSAQLAVFTEEGLAYYGTYEHSGEADRAVNGERSWIQPPGIMYDAYERAGNPLSLWEAR